jgi:hypothetical protein
LLSVSVIVSGYFWLVMRFLTSLYSSSFSELL